MTDSKREGETEQEKTRALEASEKRLPNRTSTAEWKERLQGKLTNIKM